MSSESAAPSPAAKSSGDGKQTAANVSAQQAVQRFMTKPTEPSKGAPPTADTKAPETPVSSEGSPDASQTSAAEPAKASPPEAKPTQPEAPESKSTEGEGKEGEADDVLSPESQTLDAKTKDKIQRRIDKEVGKRKALEGQIEQLQKQMTSLAQQPPKVEGPPVAQKPDASDPLPDIKDDSSLKEYRNQAKQTARWAEELLDREDIDQGIVVGKDTYTKAQIKGILRNARVALEDTIPAKTDYMQEQAKVTQTRSQITTAAVQKWPFLSERDNPEVAAARSFFQKELPSVLQSPAAEWIVGAYIKGIKTTIAEEQAQADKGKTKEPEAKPNPMAPAVTKPRPPSDQTATTTTGKTQRMDPDAAAADGFTSNYRQFKAKGNATADSAANILAERERSRRR